MGYCGKRISPQESGSKGETHREARQVERNRGRIPEESVHDAGHEDDEGRSWDAGQEGLTAQETSVRRTPMLRLRRRLCRRPAKSLTSCFLRMDMMQKQDRRMGSGAALLEAVKV